MKDQGKTSFRSILIVDWDSSNNGGDYIYIPHSKGGIFEFNYK
jgi:hypothetical protein